MNFDEKLSPLSMMIKIIFTKYIIILLNDYFNKIKNVNDIEEYKLVITNVINNSGITMVLKSLSKNYITDLEKNYFSTEGLKDFIYHQLLTLSLDFVRTHIESK